MSQLDTDGYRIQNFRNFRIRIGHGYGKIFSDMDQELKNQYPLTFAAQSHARMIVVMVSGLASS